MIAAIVFAAAVAGPGAAVTPQVWAAKPSFEQIKAAYPAGAAKADLEGAASLICAAGADGRLAACSVRHETPAGADFGAALLSLAPQFRLEPATAAPGQAVIVEYEFSANDLFDSPPGWLKRPTSADLNAVWPRKASEDGVGGLAILNCKVNLSGVLEQCKVRSEEPAGIGFGAAALLLAPAFRMKPAIRDGKPVMSSIGIPIAFRPPELSAMPTGTRLDTRRSIKIFLEAPFDRTPSYAQVVAAWPKGAPSDLMDGKTAMRCRVLPTGQITDCDFTFASSPKFERPSRDLAKAFHVRLAPDLPRESLTGIYVAVAIQFVSPARADPVRQVTHAVWTVTPDVEQVAKAYPSAALQQAVRIGRATVDCRVADDGGLADCKAVTQTPDALGFGSAAITIASAMKMTLWGDDGLPTAGASIRLPLRIVAPDGEGAAAQ